MAFPELLSGAETHEVREVYVMHVETPQLVVDISATVHIKAKALACHVSQVGADVAAVEAAVRQRAASLGAKYGLAYVEAFDRIVIER